MIEPGMTSVDLAFIVSPKELVKNEVKAFIYRTDSRTIDASQELTTTISGDANTGMLTVSVTPPDEDYWATGKTANIYIQINDGNNDVISEMIPAYFDLTPYLTFTVGGGQSLVLNVAGTLNSTIQYSADGEDWTNFETSGVVDEYGMSTTTPVFFKNNLRMRGQSEKGTFEPDYDAEKINGFMISFTENNTRVTCSGDIRTLVDYTNYETTSTENARFANLFAGCSALADASGLKLISNNNKMAESCYAYMFSVCESLTSAPALPTTILAESCYESMFLGCESLTSAPAQLPAPTLADNCYANMFASCSKLESAPVLPAKTLVTGCYWQMFDGCTKLNSVIMLATDISANLCLTNWMSGVAATGTFTKAEGMTAIPTNSVNGIPTGWTVKVKSVEQEQETLPGFNYVNGY